MKFNISVRKLVEFVCRNGDLGSSSESDHYLAPDAESGIATHKKLQQQSRPEQQTEVSVKSSFGRSSISVKLRGRIDLVYKELNESVIEEIKTSYRDLSQGEQIIPEAHIKLHQAQAKIYAYLYLLTRPSTDDSQIDPSSDDTACLVRVTYCNPETEKLLTIEERFSLRQLDKFYQQTTEHFLNWLILFKEQIQQRDRFIQDLTFPFTEYRGHQRKLSEYVYLALKKKDILLVEAPTGMGKSIASLFPAIKSIPAEHHHPIVVLTAKNSGRHSFLGALEQCQKQIKIDNQKLPSQFRAIELQAKEKVCLCLVDESKNAEISNLAGESFQSNCSRCKGFYDRLIPAMEDALTSSQLNHDELQRLAEVHQVCPHQLAMEMVPWMDLIIGDFNYGFDLQSSQLEKITGWSFSTSLIVDEAHNLIDRARDNYSANITTDQLDEFADICSKVSALAHLQATSVRLSDKLKSLGSNNEPIDINKNGSEAWEQTFTDISDQLSLLCQQVEKHQEEINNLPEQQTIIQHYYSCKHFIDTLEGLYNTFSDHYGIFLNSAEKDKSNEAISKKQWGHAKTDLFASEQNQNLELKIHNYNPGPILERYLKKCSGSIFLSATLSPIHYFSSLLTYEEDSTYTRFPSPFPAENVLITVPTYISTHYRARDESLDKVVDLINTSFKVHEGNYLICFPSFEYMDKVFTALESKHPKLPLQIQSRIMSEKQRKDYLARMTQSDKPIISFAILGGIFAESVDYIGDKLIGAIIVTLGLPSPSFERRQLSEYFDEQFPESNGFTMAYQIPGIIRVLQSAGRVIRSQKDRGIITLVDTRFLNTEYMNLLPEYWKVNRVQNKADYEQQLMEFWEEQSSLLF